MAVGDAYVFPGFLTPVLKQLFFPKPPTTFLTCRGERRKFASYAPDKNLKLKFTKGNNKKIAEIELWYLYTALFLNVTYLYVKSEVTSFYTLEVMPQTKI